MFPGLPFINTGQALPGPGGGTANGCRNYGVDLALGKK